MVDPTRRRTLSDVEITYLAEQGPGAACRITIPAGTRAILLSPGGWAVDDVPLLVQLTGNHHDPHYRYAWLPDEAFVA